MEESRTFDQWCIVEVMGHSRFAGRVTEQAIGGAAFVRVDVPEADGRKGFTKLLGPGSIFAITPVDEATARRAAAGFCSRPIDVYIPPALPGSTTSLCNDPDHYLGDDDPDIDDGAPENFMPAPAPEGT